MTAHFEAKFTTPTGNRYTILCTDSGVADLVVKTAKARGCIYATTIPAIPLDQKYAVELLGKYIGA